MWGLKLDAGDVLCALFEDKKRDIRKYAQNTYDSGSMSWEALGDKLESEASLIRLDVSISKWDKAGEEELFSLSKQIWVVFWSPRNYSGVWTAMTNHHVMPWEVEGWIHRSYHDSCWRDDGVRRGLKEHLIEFEDMCPKDLGIKSSDMRCRFSNWGSPLEELNVSVDTSDRKSFGLKIYSPVEWRDIREEREKANGEG